MGTSGIEIAEDDLAADVQARFRELAADHPDQQATERVMAEFADVLERDVGGGADLFWLALADVQQRSGRLLDEVRRRALQVIEDGGDLSRWPEERREERRGVLQELAERLQGPASKREPLEPPFRDANDWQPGDIVGYRRRSGRLVLFRVLGSYSDDGVWMEGGESCPVIELLDWQGETVPSPEEVARLEVRRDRTHRRFSRAVLFRLAKQERSSRRFLPTGLNLKASPTLREVAYHVLRRLLVALAMAPRLEVPSSTCRALSVRSLDDDLEHYYGF